jgi:hypothetical protein
MLNDRIKSGKFFTQQAVMRASWIKSEDENGYWQEHKREEKV